MLLFLVTPYLVVAIHAKPCMQWTTIKKKSLSITLFFKDYFLWGTKYLCRPLRKEARWSRNFCVFTKSIVFKQQIYFSFLRKTGVEVGVKKLVIFCRCHNCMITNVKKVMVLIMFLVQVLQWNSFPHLLVVYVRSKWKVTENIFTFKNGTKTRSCKSLFKQIVPWEQ